MFICPICQSPLCQQDRVLRCPKGHSFDIAAQGYVNLLPANKKSSKDPGDNAEMVGGRTRFLDSGSYQPLSNLLNQVVGPLCPSQGVVLDAGCGEGYYAARMAQFLEDEGKTPGFYGIDISKRAARHAATRCKKVHFAVASVFQMPIASGSADVCYNVFSPLCPTEFSRVLKPEGHFVAVYPAARHLFGLKEILYEAPYENQEKTFQLEGFQLLEKQRLTYQMVLEGNQLIQSLFMMTPYYYKTPVEGCQRLAACERLETEADFWVVTYQPEGKK